ncbi:FliM/FliN family flagellar motor switch protein [Falsigemmobacter faecalis]|uniref:Flagellar motor switch protein FliM n=1 Tax=Falsigemmobacter faecalis TaxID=2488730 RepID=A0A3P3DGT3_9RHOB|nr:FliM/FliN family flagellar motor switch protein [Falsigemmobacter faecalis]RRH73453.1 flagellar motor switch protein FliM [Falsigemmobacter faecalis]
MGDTAQILRRKLAAARPADVATETAARTWRIGLARAARDLAGLPFAPDDVRDERLSLAEVLEKLPERSFYAVLEGPGQALGLLCLSPDLVSALVEAQTLGAPLDASAAPRRLTRTDAALCAGVIDGGLLFLETGLDSSPDLAWAGGFRYSSFIEDARPLSLLLEDQPYRCLSLSGSLTGTSRTGTALLCLPAEGRAIAGRSAPSARPATDPAWSRAFTHQLGEAEVVIMAVLARIELSLDTSMELKPGSLLRIGPGDPLSLSLTGPQGDPLCPARLGRQGNQRAIKITTAQESAEISATDTEATAGPTPTLRSA